MVKFLAPILIMFAGFGTRSDHEIMLNFIMVDGPGGWVVMDVESPHDSLRMFLTQYKN
jgi:hypothetical protein